MSITDTISKTITIRTDTNTQRALSTKPRTHRYPRDDEMDTYTDTTYYDYDCEFLDVAYQRLKKYSLNTSSYGNITTLFIDHNSLTELPNPNLLPNLTILNCSYNNLTNIPLYPKLI